MKTFLKQWPTLLLKLVAPSVGVIALVAFASFIIYEGTKVSVSIKSEAVNETVQTHADTVGDLLSEVGINVSEHDEVSPSLEKSLENNMEIHHQKAKQLSLTIDDEKEEFFTTKETVGEFLEEEDLSFTEHDQVSFEENEEIKEGLELVVTTAFQVNINDGGEKTKIWSTEKKVSDFLKDHEITLSKLDEIKPSLDEKIDKDTLIEITRIEEEEVKTEEPIHFKTVKKEDQSLEKGKEKILEQGKKGTLVKTTKIIKENGEEADRTVKEKVKEEAKDRVIAVGTKTPPPPKKDLVTVAKKGNNNSHQNNSSTNDKKTFYMEATAYTAECKGCTGITATGINLNKDRNIKVVAVDPNVIPLGSRVRVEGYGEAIAGDTGGAIKGNRIDLHMPTQADAYRYGRKQNVKVEILN